MDVKAGILARYFLRRLAIARRKNKEDAGAAFNEAKAETVLVFVGAPAMATFSAVIIGSLRWLTQVQVARFDIPSKYLLAIAIWLPCAVAGNWWLNRRFAKFRADSSAFLAFASDRDQILATSQKVGVLTICGLGIPLLAFLFAFWSRL